MQKYQIILVILSLLFLSCEGENIEVFGPEIITKEATEITDSQAKLNGTLTKLGSSAITEIGFYFSSDPIALANEQGQRINLSLTANSVPLGIEHIITDLNPETKYYFRAFADIGEIEGLGEILTFTTQ